MNIQITDLPPGKQLNRVLIEITFEDSPSAPSARSSERNIIINSDGAKSDKDTKTSNNSNETIILNKDTVQPVQPAQQVNTSSAVPVPDVSIETREHIEIPAEMRDLEI